MPNQLKNIVFTRTSPEIGEVEGDIFSTDEKQFLDLLSDMMFQGIITQVKNNHNEK
jgi:hypothetical protein